MRYKFFPGSELSPPQLLGGIVDLDKPQHLVANLFVDDDRHLRLQTIGSLNPQQAKELETFVQTISFEKFSRVAISEIMHYTSRRKAMC